LLRHLAAFLPVIFFAGTLALFQWLAGMPVTGLWWKTILICAGATVLVRWLPWDRWLLGAQRRGLLFRTALFFLFVRHFAFVLLAESRRALIARRLSAPRKYGPFAFRSLACAVASLFGHSLVRAERFYAAQWVRSIGA